MKSTTPMQPHRPFLDGVNARGRHLLGLMVTTTVAALAVVPAASAATNTVPPARFHYSMVVTANDEVASQPETTVRTITRMRPASSETANDVNRTGVATRTVRQAQPARRALVRPVAAIVSLVAAGAGAAMATSSTASVHSPVRTSSKPTTPVAAGPSSVSPTHHADGVTVTQPQSLLAGVFTGPSSVWKHTVAHDGVLPNSGALVNDLTSWVNNLYGGIAAFNVSRYPVSYYTVADPTPRVNVIWDDCQHKGYTPDGLLGPGGQFTSVPVPDNAIPAAGTDDELTISDPGTDQYWEFWEAHHDAAGWHACWGGRIDHASQNPGFFSSGFGASASGLAIGAGMVSIADAQRGYIDHALTLAIPDTADWTRYVYPAQRSDGGNTSPTAIPIGTRLRLDPTIDVDSLQLNPLAAMVAKAAQTYGFVVSDTSGAVAVSTESGAGVQRATGVNPWDRLLNGVPEYLVLRNFPWSSLQALAAPAAQ